MHIPMIFTQPLSLIILFIGYLIEARALTAASKEIPPPPGGDIGPLFKRLSSTYAAYVAFVLLVHFLYLTFLENSRDLHEILRYHQAIYSTVFFAARFFFCRRFLLMSPASSMGAVLGMLAVNIACRTLSLLARIAVHAAVFSQRFFYVDSTIFHILSIVPNVVNFLLYAAVLEIVLVRYWPRREAVGRALLPAALGFCLLTAFYVREGINPYLGDLFEWARSVPEGLHDFADLLEILPPVLLLAIPLAYFSYAALLICLAIKTGGGKPGLPALSTTPAKQPSGYNRPERAYGNSYHTSGFREKEARMRKKRRYAAIALTALAAVLVLLFTIEVVRGRTGNSYDKIAVIGIVSIVLLAVIIFAVVYSTNNPPSRQTAEKTENRETPVADREFMEKTKSLRRQRFTCRLIAVLFFIPALFFIGKQEKEFEKAAQERNIDAMRTAVGKMWISAVIALPIGITILWLNLNF